jgi:thiamine biosynthesis lipoprotein
MAGTLTRRNFLSFDFGDRARDPDHWVRIHRVAMACRFEVMLSSDDARDMAAARAALDEADDLEAVLTVFRDSSVVSHLNRRGADEEVTVGPDLFDLLTRSAELHARTEGAFDVTSTPLSRCWGFLTREGRLPTDEEIEDARAVVGMQHVRLDAAVRGVGGARAGQLV